MFISDHLWQAFKSSNGVTTDTRQLQSGQLFFALSGEHFDGNVFATSALEQGALAAVISDPHLAATDRRFILVEDTLQTLQWLARKYRDEFDIPVLAITGSNGKTTTKELIASVLKTSRRVHYTQGNLNNHVGVPLTLLRLPKDTEIAIIEMGANHIGEIANLTKVADPTHGLITNIGKAHLEGFGGVEGVKKAKGELYEYVCQHQGLIFINQDDEILLQRLPGSCRTYSYGLKATNKPDHLFELVGAEPYLTVQSGTPILASFPSQLYGQYNISNILAAISIGYHFGLSTADIQRGLYAYQPVNQRSQWLIWQGHQVMMDAYNANPSSMTLAIQTFQHYPAERKILVLGDMLELGEWSLGEHQTIVDQVKANTWAEVILIGIWFGKTTHTFRHFLTTEEAKAYINKQSWPASTILFKGSRGLKLETIIQ